MHADSTIIAPAETDANLAPDSSGRQLGELSKEELDHWAGEFGLDATLFANRPDLTAAIIDRRIQIAGWNRETMLEILAWGRRAIPPGATNEQLAREITAVRSMKFAALNRDALLILARLRQAQPNDADDSMSLIRKLKRQESLGEKLRRKKRAFVGKIVSNLVGENNSPGPRKWQPPSTSAAPAEQPPRESIKEEIEESGLWGGITNRIKRTADQYLNQKLDEVEARIDRKLDEIDSRLGEWRDKEIANRLKILKITLWASVIVAVVSLIYAWMKVYWTLP